ncbi:MAG: M16 family metallopeptidase [Steroidobacteraceae bacterium]
MMHRILNLFGLLLMSVAGAASVNAAVTVSAGITQVTLVEGITEYRLDNGLKVLLFPDTSKQTVTVNITYLVGSRHENYGETGMAHLLEHMLFKGTPKHPNIPAELSAHGARPNGTTWYDRTNYFETFAATEDNLKWALDLEADRMVNSFIARKDLDTEMTVVRNEFERGENDPGSILEERMLSTAYLWHNYGHATIGARSDIENVPIERLQAFYRLYYQPDNAVLLVTGKIDDAKTLKLIKYYFGGIPKPARTLPAIYTLEPTQDGEREVTLRRTGDVQVVGAAYHVPGGAHPDFAALDILSEVLGDEPSGRLYKALVETRQAAGIDSYSYQLHDPGMVLMFAEVRQGDSLQQARDTLINAIEGLARNPPSQEEIERARTKLLKQIDLNLNASDRIGRTLSEWMGMGDWRLYFLHRDRLRQVTAADIQRVAAAYFKPSNRTTGMFVPTANPERAEIPASPDVAALLKNYKGDAAKSAGEAFDPSPANIDARTTHSMADGGIKLALLPKKTRGSTVTANLTLRFGSEQSLRNRSPAADMAGGMLMRGTGKHTRQQIIDTLNRLQARVNVTGSATSANVSIETVRDNLPAVMQLVTELLRESTFPANEFELLKQERLSSIEQQRTEPQVLASIELQRQLNPYAKGDVRYVPNIEERIADITAVTLQDARQFYQDFYGAQHGEFVVVGDFDASAIKTQFNQLFNSWRSRQAYMRVHSLYQGPAATERSIVTPDKANAVYFAGMQLQIRDDDPDYPALVLGNYMLGGGFLNSRLATRVRQKEGLSYGVGSQFNASSLDRVGLFMMYAIYAPQNLSKLETAMKQELQLAISKGFTAEEIQAAKSGWLQAQQVSRAQDAELARRLSQYEFLDRKLAWDADLEQRVAALTPEQISAALQRHFNPDQLSIIKAGDFAKTATR